jgi:NMD protein affecting ribosome stability and mRNA decay
LELRRCVYCGKIGDTTKDHVIPSCFYPPSRATSRVQRITVRACRQCNTGWADDEAHTKHVMLLAGQSNAVIQELWPSAFRAMTVAPDGQRRLSDLLAQFVPMTIDGE